MKKTTGGFEDTIILCLSVLGIIFAFPFVLYYSGKAMYDDEWNGGFCLGLMLWNTIALGIGENIHVKFWVSIFCIVAWILIFIIQHKYDLPILSGCYLCGAFCLFYNSLYTICLMPSIIKGASIVSILML